MSSLRRLLLRIVTAFRPSRAENELSREIVAHLEFLEDAFVAQGMSPDEAQRAATRRFGGMDRAKEQQRDARSFRWLDDLRRDVSYSCRTLTRTPVFTTTAILTLALGVGATSSIFTLFDAVLLRPLPVDRPEDLRVVRQAMQMGAQLAKTSTYVPHSWFLELRPEPEVFSEVMSFADSGELTLATNGRESRLVGGGLFVSDNYFELLGVGSSLGRVFTSHDSTAFERGAVLSYSCWRREFESAADVVGRPITINGAAFTVVGVTAPSFFGLELGYVPDVFLPLDSQSEAQPANMTLADRRNWSVQVVGRPQPNMTDAVAGERLTALRDFSKRLADGEARHVLHLLPIETGLSDVRSRFARPLSLLLGMGALLLLIACANVATLLGARAAARRPELVIRAAVGAGKSRLVRQLATESLVLAVLAGTIGAIWGSWATRILIDRLPQGSRPLQLDIAMDSRVLLFIGAVTLATALVAGVVPALRALGFDLAAALRDRLRGSGAASRGKPFAIVQVALSVVLVVASTMFARTIYNLTTTDLGFKPDRLVQAFVAPGERLYRGPALDQYYRAVFGRLRAVPGVVSVTSSQMQLLERARTTGTIEVPGFTPQSDDERQAQVFQIGPNYFETTGITVLRGRDFTEQDVIGQRRVAAINDVAARLFFGAEDPIGRTLSSDGEYEIVAVVRGAKYNSLREQEPRVLYVPYTSVRQRPRMTFLVRMGDDDPAAVRMVTEAARGEDPLVPFSASPMRTVVERSLSQERLLAALSIVFATAALFLLSIGLYGIMTFWVTERTPEIGIHLALGARLSRVRWVVMRQPLQLAAIGLALGLPAALAGSRAVDSLMFGVRPQDPSTIVAATVMILAVTLLACWPAARGAARVDPMTALRCE